MNKLTKIGVSALCGSLAAVASASAGSLSVSGGADASWITKTGSVGNPLGLGSNMTFAGSGDLDNGTSVALNIVHTNKAAYSASDLTWTIPGLGALKLQQAYGGIDRLDDKMPTAWEESYDTGLGTGIDTVQGVGAGMNIEWAVSSDMLPDGLSAYIAISPKVGETGANDKAGSGVSGSNKGSGYDLVLEHSGLADGLNVFAGYSHITQPDTGSDKTGDATETAIGATYAFGSITVGAQLTHDGKEERTGTDYYENKAFGISFNVSDDLSISYANHESERNVGAGGTTLEAESLQIAYTSGGATLKIAESKVDHGSYDSTTATDLDGMTIGLSLAF